MTRRCVLVYSAECPPAVTTGSAAAPATIAAGVSTAAPVARAGPLHTGSTNTAAAAAVPASAATRGHPAEVTAAVAAAAAAVPPEQQQPGLAQRRRAHARSPHQATPPALLTRREAFRVRSSASPASGGLALVLGVCVCVLASTVRLQIPLWTRTGVLDAPFAETSLLPGFEAAGIQWAAVVRFGPASLLSTDSRAH